MSEQPFEPGLPSASMESWEVSAAAPSGSQENTLKSQSFSISINFILLELKHMTKQRKKDRSGFINQRIQTIMAGKAWQGKCAGCCSHEGAGSRA